MVWLTENSIVPMLTGAFMVFAFLGLSIWAREKRMLYIALVIGAFTASIVLCEFLIVTDREAVTECIQELSRLVRDNDTDGVVSYVSKSHQDTIDRVKNELPRYRFDRCRINGVKSFESYEVDGVKSAKIIFVVFARVGPRESSAMTPVQVEITLDFVKGSDGKWRIVDYSHQDPRRDLSL